jgi:CheY-like chemotaxis protein
VDDDVDAAEALAELLRDFGHDVATAHGAEAAIQRARFHSPEVVLLDIGLPDLDGYEVARRLRDDLASKDALLVALTGYGEDRHRRLAREAGFDRHITKPVDVAQLERLLKLPL